ncbi:MAG: helix-turn-helix domain-containing protein [Tannerella sp.]|jgi:transcriptional regulator with XRE-family HTH domain|nr:helix-turn-helix domain-containing protein [Tannerella sp.]
MKNDRTLRIINIMQDKNMNATQFSEAIGIQRAAMSHIMLGRNNPSADVITRIIERFDDIDPGWLLTGKGQMKITPNPVNNSNISGNNPETDTNSDTKENAGGENSRKLNPVMSAGREPGLFDRPVSSGPQSNQNSVTGPVIKSHTETSAEENIHTESHIPAENRKGAEVNQTDNNIKVTEKEVIIYKERPNRTIDKLLIFYSDNTYETFIPEKHDLK